MPEVDMSYESSDEGETQPRSTKSNNKVPSLNETDFPETFGSGCAPTQSGISFAALNFEGQDQSASSQESEPVRRVVTRISRLREMYYKSRDVARAQLSKSWSLYIDSGLQGPEKSAECQSKLLGNIETTRALEPLIAPLRQPLGSGTNVRLFKNHNLTSPSALDENLEKGGKWAFAVSKEISRDMFEELCLYVMDDRLGYLADGCVFAVRDRADVLQIWTRSPPKPDDVNKMAQDIASILGLDAHANVVFDLHANAYKKASQAKKYFCVEAPPSGIPVTSQEQSLQPRSKNSTAADRKEKKDKKKKGKKPGDEGFTEVEIKPKKGNGHNKSNKDGDTEDSAPTATTFNPYGNLEVEQDEGKKKGAKEEPEAPIVFTKRKKPPSRKGSSKSYKGKPKDEFADLPVVEGSVVSLPVFMGGAALVILVLSVLLWSYTNNATA